jgi:acetoin utilization deacetylase AcuC-like enzyme
MPVPPFVYCPAYEADIGPHVFPTGKYRLVREALLESKLARPEDFVEPEERDRAILGLAHDQAYLDDLFGLRATLATLTSELPLTEEIVRWFELAVHGTVTATGLSHKRGGAMHLGGGFHHAFAGRAEGFCYLNDTAVAARFALGEGETPASAESISIVDVDVHQGNGTARIFQGDPRVFTFSIHQENNYPVKERSNLDIGLADGVEDEDYLRALERGLDASVRSRNPDLVYYLAGADPYREDLLGGLSLTLGGMRERDRRVFAAAREVEADVVVLLAGGYAQSLEDTVRIHAQTAEELLGTWPEGSDE